MKEDPPLDAKCRDKFLVQSVLTTSDNADNVASIWQTVEKTAKASIQERKIRVNFLPPDAGPAVNGVAAHPEEPAPYSSPTPIFGSPSPHTPATTSAASKSVSESKPATSSSTEPSSTLGTAYTAVTNVVPSSTEELQQQLAAAKAQIAKLTSQLNDPQLRQRKVQEASEKMQTVVQQSNESGVPVQIVAGLCLLSFLIAYLFF
jgi:cobalamin biosynthesis Mg chelatase CobN